MVIILSLINLNLVYLFFFSNAYGYRSFHEYILGSIFIILGISIIYSIALAYYLSHLKTKVYTYDNY